MRERLGPILRPVMHRFWQVQRGLTLGVRALVTDGERVLLVRHSYTPGWYLPGGGVEPGETAASALLRELAEEGGVVPGEPPALFGLYFNPAVSSRDHVALFVVRRWSQPSRFEPSREILAAQFFPCVALPADATAATRRRISEVLEEAKRSDVW